MSRVPQTAIEIGLTVNGEQVTRTVEARTHLADFLREELEFTGTHLGCEHGACGACTVRVDGAIVRACLMLAVQAGGTVVETVEGLTDNGELTALQQAFHRRNALQCGFCTPGMLVTALDLVRRRPGASRREIREHLAGNYCRCTGYQAIVDAVESVLREGETACDPGRGDASSSPA
jgi:carbon-monoxide dehydrogenase small subunit